MSTEHPGYSEFPGYDHMDAVVEDFVQFLADDHNQEMFAIATGEFTHLQDYIASWVERGDAIEVSGGDFGTYMRGVVRIIDAWHSDEENVRHYIRRPVEGIYARTPGASFIDPEFFSYNAMKRQLGR